MSDCDCTRRTFVRSLAAGSALLPGLVARLLADDARTGDDPLAPKQPHFAPRAKRVIMVYLSGGFSHIDSFDPKPKLVADHGKQIVADHPEIKNRPGYEKIFLKRPQWDFAPHGECGTEVSSLFPHLADSVDDLALIRSMHTSHSNHFNATLGIHTGSFTVARPSMGAWVSYGLGTENRNLPSFMVLAPQTPYAGMQVWASDFLPAEHQGTRVVPGAEPIANMVRRAASPCLQGLELEALRDRNAEHLAARAGDPLLSARIRSFETAAGMQLEAPDAFDLGKESDDTLALYGLKRGQAAGFGWQCLVARRLSERGVRFIELIDTGSSNNWDSHADMMDHAKLARNVDRPVAALLGDLKRRGMLEETLVVFTTEFGRTPFNSSADHKGREHHNWAFSSWLAGAGVRPGIVHGETDEYGMRVVKDGVHVHDFHATILHLMGFDHTKLTFRHSGRDYRLTDVHGEIVKPLLA
ncbi:MAG TPA: DUF1501 domain-containing protein [Planctomycetota bacterium]|nr:DUF1501 domain-containing protein [Planctomycetota bacterium]